VQDNWEKLRRHADQVLVNVSTKLNPIYDDLQDMRKNHKLARTKDYVLEEASAKDRVTLMQRKGMEHRVETYKEELRTYEYMVAQGFVKECKT